MLQTREGIISNSVLIRLFLLAINAPYLLYQTQYGAESATNPNIIAAIIGLVAGWLLYCGSFPLVAKYPEFRCRIGNIVFFIWSLSVILLLFHAFDAIFLGIWFALATFGTFLIIHEIRDESFEKSVIFGWIGVIFIIGAGIQWYLWINFLWLPPGALSIFNLGGAILLFPKTFGEKSEYEEKPKIYSRIRLTPLFFVAGLSIGLLMSLYRLVSENVAISNSPTWITILNGTCIASIGLGILFPKLQNLEKSGSSQFEFLHLNLKLVLSIFLGFHIVLLGIPWALGTMDLVTNTTAGTWQLIGLFWYQIYSGFAMTATFSIMMRINIKASQAIMHSFATILGIIVGIAGYLFGGTDYRVSPEIGLVFTGFIILGTIYLGYLKTLPIDTTEGKLQ
jgi:hypothetical protein